MIQIRDVRVQGAAPGDLAVTTSGDHTVLKVGNPNVTASGARAYVIDYDVPRALIPRGTTNELSWNAVGTEWTVPIRAVTVSVSAPVRIASAACRYGGDGAGPVCAGGPPNGSNVTYTRSGLAAGEGVTVDVDLAKAGSASRRRRTSRGGRRSRSRRWPASSRWWPPAIAALTALLFLPRRVPRLPAAARDHAS